MSRFICTICELSAIAGAIIAVVLVRQITDGQIDLMHTVGFVACLGELAVFGTLLMRARREET